MAVFQQSVKKYGIAIDLGTTTIAAVLVDCSDGAVIASDGGLNPQRQFGLDVISRLEYALGSPGQLKELQELINLELERICAGLLTTGGVDASAVSQVAVAGNPAMGHLLLGLPVETIARPPYRPKDTGAHRLMTTGLGWNLVLPLYLFPSPGGFVGGDMVAFLYGLGLMEVGCSILEPALFLDLGTNGEIALLVNGKLYATSAAAGPAFEAGNLSCGMAALPGAIASVSMDGPKLLLKTVADRPAAGICGSGVLDLVALLLTEGLMDFTGGLSDPASVASPLGNRLHEINGERHFVLYRDARKLISLSQNDIRQVQLAKGAVRAGMEVLFARGGVTAAEVAATVITGSFGASLSLQSLESVGVLTGNMVENAMFVKEGALAGAVRSLSSPVASVETLAGSLKIIPLSGTPLFEKHFMNCVDF